MRKCICKNDAVVICSGGGYGVACPVCGLATEKLPTQEEAVAAWENGKVIVPKAIIIPKKEEKKVEPKVVEVVEEKPEEKPVEKSVLFSDEPIRKPRRKKKV